MSAAPPTKRNLTAAVLANGPVAPGFCRMVLDLRGADRLFAPGQFFQLRVRPDGLDPLLRRPFAPSEVEADYLAFVYAVVGRGTEAMAALAAGDAVEVLLPLGRGYTLPPEPATHAVLVGGGCGAPSLLVLAQSLAARGNPVHIALGAQTASGLLEVDAMRGVARHLELATDDGTAGLEGHAVAAAAGLLDRLPAGTPVRLYGCGPEPMLRGLAELAALRQAPCEVSLEARMACGFGACVGCVVKVRDEARDEGFVYRKACQDGPVFDAATLLWD
jgi:dihydroorotate dehydrogenase electron transfer subunit